MNPDNSVENRRLEFARNQSLETLLNEIGRDLYLAEQQAMLPYQGRQPRAPSVFVMGSPRSGSTLLMQWLATLKVFSYPTNLMSRFWSAPIIGARIQKMLTDPEYSFRDELFDLQGTVDFESNHGKTAGACAPNEFWYFWRRFFQGDDYVPQSVLETTLDRSTLQAELTGVTDVLDKPFATKGMIFNENVPFMSEVLPRSVFVWIKRSPEYNVQSLLLARERQYGDMSQWYSFRIQNYSILKDLDPVESVAGQIASLHQSLEKGLQQLPSHRVLKVDYEEFCNNPANVYYALADRLAEFGAKLPPYNGPKWFEARDIWKLNWIDRRTVGELFNRMKSGI